jgi:hypothetical protein
MERRRLTGGGGAGGGAGGGSVHRAWGGRGIGSGPGCGNRAVALLAAALAVGWTEASEVAVPDHLMCSITVDTMTDPVNTVCRTALARPLA